MCVQEKTIKVSNFYKYGKEQEDILSII